MILATDLNGCIGYKNELVFKESQFSTKENINLALEKINSLNGTGEKLLDEAIEQIQKNPFDKNYKRIITIISDGAMNLNETVYNSLRNYAKDTQFITLGIGKELDYRAMNFISLATGTLPITINEPKELNQKILLLACSTHAARMLVACRITKIAVHRLRLRLHYRYHLLRIPLTPLLGDTGWKRSRSRVSSS